MKFTEAARLTTQAYCWYHSKNRHTQYTNGPMHLYDAAANSLTDRSTAGKLVTQLVGNPTGRILEIAAGTGLISQQLANLSQLTCSDVSQESLEVLRERVTTANILTADFTNLPFGYQSFEVIVNVGGFRYITDTKAYWEEMARITSSTGRVIIAQFYPRLSKLSGCDLRADTQHQASFKKSRTLTHKSDISMNGILVNTGEYLLIEFTKR